MKFSKLVEGYELACHQGSDYSVVNVTLMLLRDIYLQINIANLVGREIFEGRVPSRRAEGFDTMRQYHS
jgi:hypothetical protein